MEDGKIQAQRAKNALEDASASATGCMCNMAYTEFDDAATRARRARNASDEQEFVEYMNRTIKSYNSALNEVQICASQRGR